MPPTNSTLANDNLTQHPPLAPQQTTALIFFFFILTTIGCFLFTTSLRHLHHARRLHKSTTKIQAATTKSQNEYIERLEAAAIDAVGERMRKEAKRHCWVCTCEACRLKREVEAKVKEIEKRVKWVRELEENREWMGRYGTFDRWEGSVGSGGEQREDSGMARMSKGSKGRLVSV